MVTNSTRAAPRVWRQEPPVMHSQAEPGNEKDEKGQGFELKLTPMSSAVPLPIGVPHRNDKRYNSTINIAPVG
jgi:hypothetical protein